MPDLDYVKVIGRLGIVVVDAATDDPDVNPDTIWCDAGQVLFTPLITEVKVVGATPVPATLGQSTIAAEIDADGYLSLRGTRAVNLVDLTSAKVNPSIPAGKATHKVEFVGLEADGQPVSITSPVNVRFAADTVDLGTGAVDITLVTPVPVAGGTAQIVGPPGTSAYESWLSQGNAGSLSDFLEATTAKIWFGTTAPAGATGSIGHWSIDSVTWNVYEKTGATTWTLRGNIKGGTGAQGIPGTPGTGSVNLPTLVTNLITNPSFEVNTSGWTAQANITLVRDTNQFKSGTASGLVTQTASGGSNTALQLNLSGLTVGKIYTLSASVKRAAGTAGIQIGLQTGFHQQISSNDSRWVAGTSWSRLWITFLATASGMGSYFSSNDTFTVSTGNAASGSAFNIDEVQLTEGPILHEYFDGTTPGCYWTGTAHASTSVKGLFNAVDGAAMVRTDRTAQPVVNLIPNPSFASGVSGWSSFVAGQVSVASDPSGRNDSTAMRVTALTTVVPGGNSTAAAYLMTGLVVGRVYVWSAWVKRVVGSNPIRIAATVASASAIVGDAMASEWTRLSIRLTADATSCNLGLAFGAFGTNNQTAGDYFLVDQVQITEGSELLDYFDGDSKWSYWTGTPHASTSVYAPPQAEDLVLKRNVPTVYTNLVTNPTLEVSTAGWVGDINSTIARINGDSVFGSSCLEVTPTAANGGATRFTVSGLTVGKIYTASVYVRRSSGTTGIALWCSVNNAIDSTLAHASNPQSWTRLVLRFVPTAATQDLYMFGASNYTTAAYTAGDKFRVDGLQVTETPHPVDYFDGSSPGCEWTGAPHASTSTKRFKSKQVDLNNVPNYAENLIPNPNGSGSGNLWAAAGGNTTLTRSGRDFVMTAIAAGNLIIQTGGATAAPGHAQVVAGKTYRVRGKFRANTTGRTVQIDYGTYDSAGLGAYTASPVLLADSSSGYVEVTYEVTIPAGRTHLRLVPIVIGAAAGEVHYFTDVSVVEVGTPNAFFDGDTEGCYWTGTPNASTSVKKFPKRDDVVLTSRMPELARNWFSASPAFTVDYFATYGSTAPTKSVVAGRSPGVNAIRVVHNSVGGDHGIQISPSGLDAGNYNLTLLYRNNSANPVNVRIRTINGDSGSPQSTGATAITLPGNSGWVRHTHWFNMSAAGFAKIRVLEFYDNGNPGASVDVTEPVLTLGPNPNVEFFSGDTPGCRWLGAPEISPSIRVLHSSADYAFLTWLDVGRAQGVGSPEGRFTATVGTRYVDTAATNGARTWEKASGTGNTGWVVTEGDTGSRRIAAPGTIANAPNMEITVRRKGDVVTIHLTEPLTAGTISGSGILLGTLTAGFRPLTMPNTAVVAAPLTSNTGVQVGTVSVITSEIRAHGLVSGTRHYSTVTFVTGEPWPTTLPGTAI